MTESQDETANAATPNPAPNQAAGQAPSQAPNQAINDAAHLSTPLNPGSQGADQLTSLMSHPRVKGLLGKSLKAVACMAILGCLLLYCAITALTTIMNNALPH